MSVEGVSVILCSRDGAARVPAAIASVEGQDFAGPIELVAVDDGSTDGTFAVLEASRAASPIPMRVLRNDVNRGVYWSRSRAIDASTHPWLAFLDDDDVWHPTRLSAQAAYAEDHPEVALIHAAVVDVLPDGRRQVRYLHRRADEYEELLVQDRIATSTVLLRKDAFLAVGGYDERVRAFGDWTTWTDVARIAPIHGLASPLVDAHLRDGSIQRGDPVTFARWRTIALEKRRPALRAAGLERLAEARHHYAIGGKFAAAGRRREAARALVTSLLRRPTPEAFGTLLLLVLPGGARTTLRLWLRRANTFRSRARRG